MATTGDSASIRIVARTNGVGIDRDVRILADAMAGSVDLIQRGQTALEFTELRTLAGESSGKGPGPESSILKIKGTEIQQRLQELALEAVGHYGAPFLRDMAKSNLPIGPDYAEGAAGEMFNGRKTSIYGGSNEIQRNIVAKALLGL